MSVNFGVKSNLNSIVRLPNIVTSLPYVIMTDVGDITFTMQANGIIEMDNNGVGTRILNWRIKGNINGVSKRVYVEGEALNPVVLLYLSENGNNSIDEFAVANDGDEVEIKIYEQNVALVAYQIDVVLLNGNFIFDVYHFPN